MLYCNDLIFAKRNIIFIFILLEICIQYISCNDAFLSKFRQNLFKMKDHRVDVISYNKNYFNTFEAKTYKYNRTTPAINGSMNLKVTVKDKVEVVVQVFKFLSNEYRHFPIRYQINLKMAADYDLSGLEAVKNCGNIATFSFEKDITYYFCNFLVDETRYPPLIPNGRYKSELTLLYLNEEIALVAAYVEIYTPIPYPKN